MDFDILSIKEFLDIASTVATVVTIILGYKVLIYDANKKKAEIGVTNAEKTSIEEQTEKTQMEMVGVLITSSKELIGVYKEITDKLESTIKHQQEDINKGKDEREKLRQSLEQVIREKDECHNEIVSIKKKVLELEKKLEEMGEQNGRH